MNHIVLELRGEVFNDEGIVGALVHANTASNAQALRNVRFTGFVIEDDAFLTISNRWAEGMTFIVALLWLTTVFLQNGYSHCLTPSPCVDVIG